MFKTVLIRAAFSILDKLLIKKINFEPLRKFFDGTLGKAKNVAEILTDKNPQNEAQLAEFWRANQAQILDESFDLAKEVILKKMKTGWLKDALEGIFEAIDNDGNINDPDLK